MRLETLEHNITEQFNSISNISNTTAQELEELLDRLYKYEAVAYQIAKKKVSEIDPKVLQLFFLALPHIFHVKYKQSQKLSDKEKISPNSLNLAINAVFKLSTMLINDTTFITKMTKQCSDFQVQLTTTTKDAHIKIKRNQFSITHSTLRTYKARQEKGKFTNPEDDAYFSNRQNKKENYSVWLKRKLIGSYSEQHILYNANKADKNRVMNSIVASRKNPNFKPIYLDLDILSKLQGLTPSETLLKPSVTLRTVEEAIASHKGLDIPTIIILANAYFVCGFGYPIIFGTQEEGSARKTNFRLGQPGKYPPLNTKLGDTVTFTDFLDGLYLLGGSYRTENCSLYSVDGKTILPSFKKFHQVSVAARNFRDRSKETNADKKNYYEKLKKFFEANPKNYIEEMALFAHYQYQHTLASGSKTLYAGALGCGAFRNSATLVAFIHMAALQYKNYDQIQVDFSISGKWLTSRFQAVFKYYSELKKSAAGRYIIAIAQGDPSVTVDDLSDQTLSDLVKKLDTILDMLIENEAKEQQALANNLAIIQKLLPQYLSNMSPNIQFKIEDGVIMITSDGPSRDLKQLRHLTKAFSIDTTRKHDNQLIITNGSHNVEKFVEKLQTTNKGLRSWIALQIQLKTKTYKSIPPYLELKKSNNLIVKQPTWKDANLLSGFIKENRKDSCNLHRKEENSRHEIGNETYNYSAQTHFNDIDDIAEVLSLFGCDTDSMLIRFYELHQKTDPFFAEYLLKKNLRNKGDLSSIQYSLQLLEKTQDLGTALTIIKNSLALLTDKQNRYNKKGLGLFEFSQKSAHKSKIEETFQVIVKRCPTNNNPHEKMIKDICKTHDVSDVSSVFSSMFK